LLPSQADLAAAFCALNETFRAKLVAKSSPQPENQSPSRYGGWDYARDLTNHVFALIHTGQVFPAFGLLLLLLSPVIGYLLPESERAPVLYELLATIRSSSGIPYLALLGVIVGASWLIRRQGQMYRKEIDRLAAIRSELMHGEQPRTLIKEHRSSAGEQVKSVILPEISPPPQEGGSNP